VKGKRESPESLESWEKSLDLSLICLSRMVARESYPRITPLETKGSNEKKEKFRKTFATRFSTTANLLNQAQHELGTGTQ